MGVTTYPGVLFEQDGFASNDDRGCRQECEASLGKCYDYMNTGTCRCYSSVQCEQIKVIGSTDTKWSFCFSNDI